MTSDILQNLTCPKCASSAVLRESVFETSRYLGWLLRCGVCRYGWLLKVTEF